MKLVVVSWMDAHVPHGTWVHIDDAKDDGPYYVTTVGFLLKPEHGGKKGHVSIVQSWGQDDYVDGILHIPSKMVKEQITLYEKDMQVTPSDFKSAVQYLSRVTPRGDDDQKRLLTLIERLNDISDKLTVHEASLAKMARGN